MGPSTIHLQYLYTLRKHTNGIKAKRANGMELLQTILTSVLFS